jgi:hypothetical protein
MLAAKRLDAFGFSIILIFRRSSNFLHCLQSPKNLAFSHPFRQVSKWSLVWDDTGEKI